MPIRIETGVGRWYSGQELDAYLNQRPGEPEEQPLEAIEVYSRYEKLMKDNAPSRRQTKSSKNTLREGN